MKRVVLPLLLLTSCALQEPTMPELPPLPAPVVKPEPPPEPAQVTQIVYVPTPAPPPPTPALPVAEPKTRGKAGVKAPVADRPDQVIQQALKAAEVYPTPHGYFGNSAVHRFLWQPLAVYHVPVTMGHATQIQLPHGERLAAQLALDPEEWSIGQTDVGNELVQTSILTVQPKRPETPQTYVVLLTQSGRSFYLHLIPGKVGMLALTWEVPPVRFQYVEESPLPPKAQP